MRLKRKHPYYYKVQQQLFTAKKCCCDFIVCGFDESGASFVHERIMPDELHWRYVVLKLSHYWQYCILPDLLGRWYTWWPNFLRAVDKCKTKDPVEHEYQNCDTICICKKRPSIDDKIIKCQAKECTNGICFHLSCLGYKRYQNNSKLYWISTHLQGKQTNNMQTVCPIVFTLHQHLFCIS